jgi:hypothetical protein
MLYVHTVSDLGRKRQPGLVTAMQTPWIHAEVLHYVSRSGAILCALRPPPELSLHLSETLVSTAFLPPPIADDALEHENHGPWTFTYFSQTTLGNAHVYGVEISLGDVPKARTTVSRALLNDAHALTLLRSRALGWIADYEKRDHSGTSDFSEL